MTARFKERYSETVVELTDWRLDSIGWAHGVPGKGTRIFLVRDLEPINDEARSMRDEALAAEALAARALSWPEAFLRDASDPDRQDP